MNNLTLSEQIEQLEVELDNLRNIKDKYISVKLTNTSLHHKIPEITEENLMLADENQKMAKFLKEIGYTANEINNIATGWDDIH